MKRLIVFAFLGILLMSGCGNSDTSSGPAASGAGSEPQSKSIQISRADFGQDWPFTVEKGTLTCQSTDEVLFTAEGTTYALNGVARGEHIWADIDKSPIWIGSDPNKPDVKDVSPVIERALSLYKHDK